MEGGRGWKQEWEEQDFVDRSFRSALSEDRTSCEKEDKKCDHTSTRKPVSALCTQTAVSLTVVTRQQIRHSCAQVGSQQVLSW